MILFGNYVIHLIEDDGDPAMLIKRQQISEAAS
jgi:hypothetical protein